MIHFKKHKVPNSKKSKDDGKEAKIMSFDTKEMVDIFKESFSMLPDIVVFINKLFGCGFQTCGLCMLIDGNTKERDHRRFDDSQSRYGINIIIMLRLTGKRKLYFDKAEDPLLLNGLVVFEGNTLYAGGDNSDSEGHNAALFWILSSETSKNVKSTCILPHKKRKCHHFPNSLPDYSLLIPVTGSRKENSCVISFDF
jgi:hypothetical protein